MPPDRDQLIRILGRMRIPELIDICNDCIKTGDVDAAWVKELLTDVDKIYGTHLVNKIIEIGRS
jgi:hypothetical protein